MIATGARWGFFWEGEGVSGKLRAARVEIDDPHPCTTELILCRHESSPCERKGRVARWDLGVEVWWDRDWALTYQKGFSAQGSSECL
ncbi:hypothetical protein N7510_010901 [Penicillium lagena]|uniref:uncharacterized protein n=1 Tax=Penicillium lagena TaxID=94218 RepID=UPI002542470C|nr:uncharacterized protein N7510_010901 [Penicillium lagena]KAJ5601367.1 hypothetical protein N7510_010901 [Penicillium lagena]